jgi:hypothetical protein
MAGEKAFMTEPPHVRVALVFLHGRDYADRTAPLTLSMQAFSPSSRIILQSA